MIFIDFLKAREEKNKYGMLAQNFNRSTNVAMEHNGRRVNVSCELNNEIMMITAEEFFRNKIKEQNPNREVVTLSQELITAEQGMRWAHEFKQLHLHDVVGRSEQLKAVEKLKDFAYEVCPLHREDDLEKIVDSL